MLNRWWRHLRQMREQRVLQRRAIPDPLWQLTLARFPFLTWRTEAEQQELRRLATLFLDRKEFFGAGGFELSDEVAVAVATQACLPVLKLGLEPYDSFVGIVMHPGEVLAQREVMDEDGIVHRYREPLAGEAMEGGPVMLSWQDVCDAGEHAGQGYNVVVHEFVHVLDLLDGEADGTPPLPTRAEREAWQVTMQAAYADFCDAVDSGTDTFLDPYGAEGIDEFFPVAAESFFVSPLGLARHYPKVYGLLRSYFQQDPARHVAP